jgi:3-oxoacyl-[acyl-carrier protein] reductase
MPKVLTAEFFRRGIADSIRCVAIAPGYCATPILKGMNQNALDKILKDVPIGRLVEPEEVASLVCELYQRSFGRRCIFHSRGTPAGIQRIEGGLL